MRWVFRRGEEHRVRNWLQKERLFQLMLVSQLPPFNPYPGRSVCPDEALELSNTENRPIAFGPHAPEGPIQTCLVGRFCRLFL